MELDASGTTTHRNQARQSFGIVFQDPSLDGEQTAWENMELHGISLSRCRAKFATERTERLLKLFELWDRRNDYAENCSPEA